MADTRNPESKSSTAFRSAAEEAKMKRDGQGGGDEGGHMSSTAGRVMRMPGAELPYIVTLTHHLSDSTRHGFATMRDAEAFIKRNTPPPRALLSTIYDRPAPDAKAPSMDAAHAISDEFAARLKSIDRRLRRCSTDEAASILATALVCAGITEQEQLRLLAETERLLDERDGNSGD